METSLTEETLKVVTGVSTFATATFVGMLLMASPTQRVALTFTFATLTVLLMWTAP